MLPQTATPAGRGTQNKGVMVTLVQSTTGSRRVELAQLSDRIQTQRSAAHTATRVGNQPFQLAQPMSAQHNKHSLKSTPQGGNPGTPLCNNLHWVSASPNTWCWSRQGISQCDNTVPQSTDSGSAGRSAPRTSSRARFETSASWQ